jgi:ParB/RepB/Spo0J family partition protein
MGEQSKQSVVFLSVDQVHPNDYNPNRMEEAGFEELLTEVRHLGRLPKPVIVRRNEAGYQIVDGEHGWRAAKEVGLAEIPCEVIQADDFEAMRQTYKRNQHGSHAPTALGRMFRRMMESREFSLRALAEEIAVSEGTVRNAIQYAEASDLRNSYAFDDLSVRQVRTYLALPAAVRDIWLDAGADLKELQKAANYETVGEEKTKTYADWGCFRKENRASLAWALDSDNFVESSRRLFQFFAWKDRHGEYIKAADAYFAPIARLNLPLRILDEFLPARAGDDEIKILVTPEQWDAILKDCDDRAADDAERDAMIKASVRLALQRQGISQEDLGNPRVALLLESAPDFIRGANIPLSEKIKLILLDCDVPDDVLLAAKRQACERLETRQAVLAGEWKEAFGEEAPTSEAEARDLQASWASWTPGEVCRGAISDILRERSLSARHDLFGDRDQLKAAVLKLLQKLYVFREHKIGDRRASELLWERLSALPWPEFVFLAAHLTGHESPALSFWIKEVCAELGCEDSDPRYEQAAPAEDPAAGGGADPEPASANPDAV